MPHDTNTMIRMTIYKINSSEVAIFFYPHTISIANLLSKKSYKECNAFEFYLSFTSVWNEASLEKIESITMKYEESNGKQKNTPNVK